jgi:hypothetical protein
VANWELTYGGEGIISGFRNLTRWPVVSITKIADGSTAAESCPSGKFKLEVVTDSKITITGYGKHELHSSVLKSAVTVSYAEGNANKSLFPGFSVCLSTTAEVGDSAIVYIGCTETGRCLSHGFIPPGFGSLGAIALLAENSSGLLLSDCLIVATNAIRIDNSGVNTPFAYFYQRGKNNPDPDADSAGLPVTFAQVGTWIPEEVFSLLMAANDDPAPNVITASSEDTDYEGYRALDYDEDTSWTTTDAPTELAPATWELDFDTGEELFNKLIVTCGADSDQQPTNIKVYAYYGGAYHEVASETSLTITDDAFTVAWSQDTAASKYKIEVTDTAGNAVLDIIHFQFSFVDPTITYQLLIDGEEQEVIETTTGAIVPVGTGIALNTEYQFPDSSKYRGLVFKLSSLFTVTDTATIYVSDGGASVELGLSEDAFVLGSSGIEITGASQEDGVVGDGQTVTFYLRLRCNDTLTSEMNQRNYSLRVVGYDEDGNELTIEHVGAYNVADIGASLSLQLSLIQNEYDRPTYTYVPSEDPYGDGSYVEDPDGLYVVALDNPWAYVLTSADPQSGKYKSITEVLEENGIEIL